MPDKVFIDTNTVIYSLGQAAAPLFVDFSPISTQMLSQTAKIASKRLELTLSVICKKITSLGAICRVESLSLFPINTAHDIRDRFSQPLEPLFKVR
jgi:predicted nucleic acid-binding protein